MKRKTFGRDSILVTFGTRVGLFTCMFVFDHAQESPKHRGDFRSNFWSRNSSFHLQCQGLVFVQSKKNEDLCGVERLRLP